MTERTRGFRRLPSMPARSRPDHRGARHPDLPDHVLRVRGRRSCRLPVRAADFATSTPASAIRPMRCWRNGSRRSKAAPPGSRRVRPRRPGAGVSRADEAGRRVRRVQEALWRLDQPVQSLVQEFRLECGVGRPRRHRHLRARHQPQTKAIFIESIANPGGVITTSRRWPISRGARACR